MSSYQGSGGYRSRGYSSGYQPRGRGSSRGGYGNYNNNGYRGRPQSSSSASSHSGGYGGGGSYRARQNLYQQHSVNLRQNELQLWMGDLDPNWTEEWITALWTKLVSRPQQVKLMRDKLNPLRASYCFVTFRDQESVDLAIQRNGQKVPDSDRVFKLNHSGKHTTTRQDHHGASTPDYSMFIGDLAPEVSDATLFSKFNMKYPNQIKQAKVIVDLSTKKSKGFGFVKFLSPEVMNKALKEMQGYTIGSKAIRVGLAAGSGSDASSQPITKFDYHKIHLQQQQPPLNQFTDPSNTSLTIKGLSSRVTEFELEQHFIAFGDLVYCQVSNDFQTGYVKFYLRSAAETAVLNLHGYIINDCRLQIYWGSSILVQGGDTNYAPNTLGEVYDRAKRAPTLYVSADYPHQRFDKLLNKEIARLSHRVSGNTPLLASQIDELHLNHKRHRESLLEEALY
ncbi:putative RNA-binding protein C23E6.01c [Candida viswanathii]|uniref:Putative RNA-binding protein C23E6.01c n=1 Tax=Candida viswanathii TaxID=5486 RepID=A0A367XL48_9ASCO|nr:putative RNA-binding protein C23E6.01c [Candida viswanathii]